MGSRNKIVKTQEKKKKLFTEDDWNEEHPETSPNSLIPLGI